MTEENKHVCIADLVDTLEPEAQAALGSIVVRLVDLMVRRAGTGVVLIDVEGDGRAEMLGIGDAYGVPRLLYAGADIAEQIYGASAGETLQ